MQSKVSVQYSIMLQAVQYHNIMTLLHNFFIFF